ncbi:vanadium-dependent haloperoxidase [Roseofilum casamattae]|uniref:Vanadium-dependent haloperoxidase n=1 Tax=Roseofilum casamattae BLCC-M143 TaxID=3022442 RepID=A0ABT7C293_9CYAN|nr:vanadium-dependent haloperoxidase [Roseofilum casamattae]MDJ1185577.1 vanadium-dependent haloperoxidase [Roseofilum casamattae BLCC-M143]
MNERRHKSYSIRVEAAELAKNRPHPPHKANGDEKEYSGDRYFMSFTKGLIHNPNTGLLEVPNDFEQFREAIDGGFIKPFTDNVRHGAKYKVKDGTVVPLPPGEIPNDFRQWEAPTAGVVFELEGPDAQAVTMPPAPPLVDATGDTNPELIFEMAEVYELAILRDIHLNHFEAVLSPHAELEVGLSINRLNQLDYIKNQTGRPRKVNQEGKLDVQTVFRGSSPGVEVGPYLSQFLLIGNQGIDGKASVQDGKIAYGAQEIDQRVPVATPNTDYMTQWDKYVEVQQGIRPDRETYTGKRRFISTPRDLATYVHYDALYQAYLNACLILLGMGTPFDPLFDCLSGGGAGSMDPETRLHTSGFALYGGPHILTLVTEVATRALKAVRFQKFNTHIRLRPEALAARIELLRTQDSHEEARFIPDALIKYVQEFIDKLTLNGGSGVTRQPGTLQKIAQIAEGSYLLPMAFPEGSPMHPAYGAGHATVAGACVTILKAFFDTDPETVLVKSNGGYKFKRMEKGDTSIAFRANKDGSALQAQEIKNVSDALTLEGELNKLAANISIGRNMAGVHYFTDYYDSIRMGEQIAIGILEEQALTYCTDPFVLSLRTFDGDEVKIGHQHTLRNR